MDTARQVESGLRLFQDSFADALLAPADAVPSSSMIAALTQQPGFAVYRNTVLKGCIDALQANYPAVARLVGEEWFRAAAAVYSRAHLPSHPSLIDHGRDFADFLAGFEPAQELPYLADVARLDRCWTEAHMAGDATPVAAETVAGLTTDELAVAVLHPHPAARWAWFAEQPIMTIWTRNRSAPADADDGAAGTPDIDWHGEGALITRPLGQVEWTELSAAGCSFLDACARGATLSAAASAAFDSDPHADLARMMAVTLQAGAFSNLSLNNVPPEVPNR